LKLLTKLEEMVLIAVLRLKDKAYGVAIYKYVAGLTSDRPSMSSVYFPLERLVRRGFLSACLGDPTPERGGLRKKYYTLTEEGLQALQDNRDLMEKAWRGLNSLRARAVKD
jgi:PadR family transcriptional regulator PadR